MRDASDSGAPSPHRDIGFMCAFQLLEEPGGRKVFREKRASEEIVGGYKWCRVCDGEISLILSCVWFQGCNKHRRAAAGCNRVLLH